MRYHPVYYHSYSYSHAHLGHVFGRAIVHGIGWGIGYQLVRHLPFMLIVIIALAALAWYFLRRRE